jgi:hypothetical protein
MLDETRKDIAVCWQMERMLKHPVASRSADQDTTPQQWEIVRDAQSQLRFNEKSMAKQVQYLHELLLQ